MHNVTLVFTYHSELGRCNSDELYKIIESITPDVIFEELPEDLFIRFYPENQLPYEPPEVNLSGDIYELIALIISRLILK